MRIPTDLSATELVKFTNKNWDALDPLYRFWGERWKRVVDFLRAQHWNTLKELHLNQLPRWRRYPVLPITISAYNSWLGQWLQSKVRWSAVPASPDPADIAAADMAETALAHAWDITEMDAKKVDLGAWLLATGNAALRTYWNADTGNMVPLAIPQNGKLVAINPETGQPDPTIQPIMVDAGELAVEVLNPQLVRYPRAKRHGVMVGSMLSEDEVAEKYGEQAVAAVRFSKTEPGLAHDLSFMEAPGIAVGSDDTDRALIIEHYLPRCKKHPGGLWWTTGSKDTLLTKPQGLPGGIEPITQFRFLPLPGSRLGITPMYEITYANKVADEITGKIQEWTQKVLPKLILKEGGGIAPGDSNEEPGQELVANVGGEPEWRETPPVPPEFFQFLKKSEDWLQLGMGLPFDKPDQPDKGSMLGSPRRPTTQESGHGLAACEIASKASWEHHAKVVLSYIKTFYTEGRMMSLSGPDKLYQWRAFDEVSLEKLPTAVKVDEIPLYSHSRQATRDTVIGLMASPASQVLFSDIGPDGNLIMDKDRIEVAMQATGIDVGLGDLDPDIAEARNEHAFHTMGMPVKVENHMNHALHLAEHEKVKKGMTFKSWPPEAQQALDADIQQHQQILSQAAQQQEQKMIETERQMREVRETTESQAEVRKMIAEMVIEVVGETIKEAITEALGDNKKEEKGE